MLKDQFRAEHTPEAIVERLSNGGKTSYLRDFIFGAVDGLVTTFAIVAGVYGASMSSGVIIILGLANLVADGLSMAASNFLGTRAEEQRRRKMKKIEEQHIAIFPEGEREEIRQIFKLKGFEGQILEDIVQVITSDKKLWVSTMLQDEHGLALESPSAIRAASATFVAFVLIGFVPLFTFVVNWFSPEMIANPFIVSIILTGIAFFLVGAVKAPFVLERWWVGGIETTLLGGTAAALAFLIGWSLREMVPI